MGDADILASCILHMPTEVSVQPFKRFRHYWKTCLIHEKMLPKGTVGHLKSVEAHFGFSY